MLKAIALAACLALTTPLAAGELQGIVERLGPGRDAFEGIATRADCTGPDGTFSTEIISLADGTARFVQVDPDGRTELLVVGDRVYGRKADHGALESESGDLAAFVHGHEVHRMLLDLDRRFRSAGRPTEAGCLDLVQPDGLPARICLDAEGLRPRSIEIAIADEIGGGRVRIEFDDWREVVGVSLPFRADFIHGDERFAYRFRDVLPFRLAPSSSVPEAPTALHERLGDLAEIAAVHRRMMQAHLDSDVDALLADEADPGTISRRGRLAGTTHEEMRGWLAPYLGATRFTRYADRVVPIVAVSHDGTMGWLACEMEAAGVQTDDDGSSAPLEFGFSWIELLARRDGHWVRVANASSQRPETSPVAEIPFEIRRNKIILPVTVGDSPVMEIILDTGMPGDGLLIYRPTLRKHLPLDGAEEARLHGAGSGAAAGALRVESTTFRVGELTLTEQPLLLLLDDRLDAFPSDGVIGYSLLGHYAVEIDFDRRRLVLHDPSRFHAGEGYSWIPLTFRDNRIPWTTAGLSVDGGEEVGLDLYIDGASGEALELLLRDGQKFDLPRDLEPYYLGRGLSGDIHGQKGRVASLRLGPYTLRDVTTAVAPAEVRSRQFDADGVLGNNALRRFNLVFHYDAKRLYLKPNAAFDEPFAD